MSTYFALLVIVAVVAVGLLSANLLMDMKVPNYMSRKVGHLFGGAAYLLAVLWLDFLTAILVSAALTIALCLARLWAPGLLRGIGGSGRPHAFAELTYPIAATASLAIGWGLMGDRWLALVPILFMAWGDAITGCVRTLVYKREVKGIWGSMAMAIVCLGVAAWYQPYWVGAAGAVTATVAEKLSPIARGWLDDNWVIIATSLASMGVMSRL